MRLIKILFGVDNQPEVTEILKRLLKDDYNYDSTVRNLVTWHW